MHKKNNKRKHRNPTSRKHAIMPVPVAKKLPESYSVLLINLKKRIQQELLKVVLSANAALVMSNMLNSLREKTTPGLPM